MQPKIPFNKPFITGKEIEYIASAINNGNVAADGFFTRGCARLLEDRFAIPRVLMTPSCTSALELAAMLCDLKSGDEVIMPSFTFVSTANAVVRAGAKPPRILRCGAISMPDAHKQMIKAIKSGDVEKVKNLLASDASLIQARDIDGSTPLHCGCESTKPSQKPGSPFWFQRDGLFIGRAPVEIRLAS